MTDLNFVRPMTLREIFSNALILYKRHFRTFFAIFLLYIGLIYTLEGIIRWTLSEQAQRLVHILVEPLLSLAFGATVIAVSNAVLGRPVRMLDAYRRVLTPRIILILVVFSLPFQLMSAAYGWMFETATVNERLSGFFFSNFVFPALVVAVHTLLLFRASVTVLEKRGLFDSIRRVLRLVFQNFDNKLLAIGFAWRLMIFLLLLALPVMVALPPAMIYALVTGRQLTEGALWLLMNATAALFDLFINPYGLLLSILLYYDIRARKEGYNALVLAEEMGYQPITEMIAI